ncbi:MAG: hypothetical protein Q9226_007734, partial [Calogaya cf. arnoldii]
MEGFTSSWLTNGIALVADQEYWFDGLILTLCLWAIASTAFIKHPQFALNLDEGAEALPTLTLPYATYRAARYDPNGDYYVFKNIRFAAPPTGSLRWAPPAAPSPESTVQDGSYGPICIQAPIKGPRYTGPGSDSPIGEALNQYIGGIPLPSFKKASEDCLFLDVYVPKKAVEDPSLRLPVISWFFGGAYTFGGKDSFDPVVPFYAGTGLLQQTNGNVIVVTSNYRLGAYGFLAGNTMEKDGLPNAGLYDQRAALQWIQSYISLVGGDKSQVSAWGLSAGAGSIMHHLVSFGGEQDPLFSRAVLQSPAFQLMYDRKGKLEETFQNFTTLAGCGGKGVACLRAASPEALEKANWALNTQGPPGTFAVGPAADGKLIRQHPALELASGHFSKIPTSLIFSHTSDEADMFVPINVQTDKDFSDFVDSVFVSYAKEGGVNAAIEARYPPVMGIPRNYTTEYARLKDVLQDSTFVCNIRDLSNAYTGKNYNLKYSVTPGLHAVDLLPTFYNLNLDLDAFDNAVPFPLIPGFGSFAQVYQSYLTSHARSGDPNTYRKKFSVPPTIAWPKPGASGDAFTGVLNVGDLGFRLVTDGQSAKSRCDFWRDVAAAVTNLGGYAPPGSVVPTTLVPVKNDP